MKIFRLTATALLTLLAVTGPAIAQDKAAAPAAEPDTEEALDEAFKRFGYLAGLAQVCVTKEQKPALEREVLDLNSSIVRLFGVDRGFLFSTSFGYGTSVDVTEKDCTEVLSTYEARVAKHRAAAGGIK